jgi:hypothetical protein
MPWPLAKPMPWPLAKPGTMINAAPRSGIIFQQCGEGGVNHKPSTATFAIGRTDSMTCCGGMRR